MQPITSRSRTQTIGATLGSLFLSFATLSSPRVQAEPLFLRGDVDQNGALEISDPIGTLGYLFLGSQTPGCLDAADANDDGALNLTDALYSLSFLFSGGAPIPPPYPDCGADRTPDQIGCAEAHSPRCSTPPVAIAARALSRHYVLVSFDAPVIDALLTRGSTGFGASMARLSRCSTC
jgi:hypothetical protein